MGKIILMVLFCLSCTGLAVAQDKGKLADVEKIFIGDLGHEEGSDLIREKIRKNLTKSYIFTVVESPEAADAILTGVVGVEQNYQSAVHSDSQGNIYGYGGSHRSGNGMLRLIHVKSQETIWDFEYKRGISFSSASSRVAEKAVEKLIQDVKEAERFSN